jgi:hypothetical protein
MVFTFVERMDEVFRVALLPAVASDVAAEVLPVIEPMPGGDGRLTEAVEL